MDKQLDTLSFASLFSKVRRPVIISGPCSAETEEQVIGTARLLAAAGKVNVFRAGIWKPRTRPDSFEGIGSEALIWLKNAGNETGLPVATEVANGSHVEQCLKAGIDMLWIGARTAVSPFAVQEIADALKGHPVPVMVKNPIHPDLNLWIGALERLNRAGITRLAAIHRGFSSYETNHYRYAPNWEIPIALKTRFPELEIICDPSHIAGKADLLGAVAQKALDLDMAGLMIESHIQPEKALSDAAQQITPDTLSQLLNELTIRKAKPADKSFNSKLEHLRSIIDEIDAELLRKLQERVEIVEKIGEYKKDNNVTILQLERWKEILSTRIAYGSGIGLDQSFVRKLLQTLHEESIRLQTEVMNNANTEIKQEE